MKKVLAILTLAGAALLMTAGPAMAHNVLVSSDPANGSSVSAGPAQIRLVFDQPVQAGFNTISVVGPDGSSRWEGGSAAVDGATVTAAVRPLGPAGQYTIGYRILSADGHPVTGEVKFSLTTAGSGTPAPPSAAQSTGGSGQSADSGGMPVWPWIAGAVVVLGLGVVLALRLGKSDGK